MWIFVIIIIAFIVLKFIYDTAKQSSEIKSEGGIRKKYAFLVDYFLSCDKRSHIFQENNTFVSVGVSGIAGSQIYYIYSSYGKVSIRLEVKNNPLIGNLKMEWSFPENMNQEHMIEKINYDMEQRIMSITKNL